MNGGMIGEALGPGPDPEVHRRNPRNLPFCPISTANPVLLIMGVEEITRDLRGHPMTGSAITNP